MSKIPHHAQRVFKGEIFSVYQWQQEMFDGTYATFECLKRPNTVIVVPMIGDKICYSIQEQPGKPEFLGLFGGRAEEGEDPLTTGKRELLEESGLASDDWQEWFSFKASGKMEWNIYYFIARNCRKVCEPKLDGGERITMHTTTFENFINNIVPDERFLEKEMYQRLFNAFNQAKAEELKTLLTSPQPNA